MPRLPAAPHPERHTATDPAVARDRSRVARRLIGASIDLGGLAILLTQAWRLA